MDTRTPCAAPSVENPNARTVPSEAHTGLRRGFFREAARSLRVAAQFVGALGVVLTILFAAGQPGLRLGSNSASSPGWWLGSGLTQEVPTTVFHEFQAGTISMRCLQFGGAARRGVAPPQPAGRKKARGVRA